jgi:hypothetical protein
MEGSGVCVACGAGGVDLNEENKCPGCTGDAADMGTDMPAAEAPAEGGMEAPAEEGMEAPAESEEAAPEMPAEGGEM